MDTPIDTYEQARASTRRNAKTFFFASHALPPGKRMASYALYSFCRHVDNIADSGEATELARARLVSIRDLLDRICDPGSRELHWGAFRETVMRYGIPKQYFLDLIEGVDMDLRGVQIATFEDLRKYCYHVASVVGLIMTRVFQPDEDAALSYAEHLGTAMQLTNILRDIGEDYRMHRIYLPSDEMRQHGISGEDLRCGTVTPAFRRFMQWQIARARHYYAMAEPGIALLPNDGSRYTVKVMSLLYSRILDAIEAHDYDVFTHRAYVPLRKKIRLAAGIAIRGHARPYVPGTRQSGTGDAGRVNLARPKHHPIQSQSDGRKELRSHE